MITIYAITLKDWNMPEAQPQEYFTSMRKAEKQLRNLARIMELARDVKQTGPYRYEGTWKDKTCNQAPRVFEIEAINVQ